MTRPTLREARFNPVVAGLVLALALPLLPSHADPPDPCSAVGHLSPAVGWLSPAVGWLSPAVGWLSPVGLHSRVFDCR